jgi:hypothetical protein
MPRQSEDTHALRRAANLSARLPDCKGVVVQASPLPPWLWPGASPGGVCRPPYLALPAWST